ncbi:MAG: hypothetical protein WB014_03345, partial [Methanosarcina sp.]
MKTAKRRRKNKIKNQNWVLYPTFRRCLQKNNIFLVIVFGELFESAVSISTEASENGDWKFSM